MRILFIVNGLGLGNSTRCHAVIQRLVPSRAEIAVATSTNGLWYFADRLEVSELIPLTPLFYGSKEGRLSVASTIRSLRLLWEILRENSKKLEEVLDQLLPDVVVVDSMYSFRPVKRRRIPLVALNNSDCVHVAYRRFADKPSSIRSQFVAVEEMDYLFHSLIPDKTISPTIDPTLPQTCSNFLRTGPIVRKECQSTLFNRAVTRVAVMLSGSTFGTPVRMKRSNYPFTVDVLGREAPHDRRDCGNVVYHGRVKASHQVLNDADVIVVNGGFSAVSEGFWMCKPMLVIPVHNHAEQWLNARIVEHLGVGLMGTEENLEEAMMEVVAKVEHFRNAYRKYQFMEDGAEVAARTILEMGDRRSHR